MGKGQSKHGECYLVNAHFNPLCQLEETNSLQSVETPLTSQDSGLQLTPEISFTLSEEDDKNTPDKSISTKCALQVFLPKEGISAVLKNSTMEKKNKEAGEETSADSQQKVTLEYIQSNNQTEEQEFSFVLKNYTGAEQNDVEKMVLSSICEALQSSLKLPSSGTHTLKVHLTLSPEQDKNLVNTSVDEDAHKPSAKPVLHPNTSNNPCQPCAGHSALPEETSTPQKQTVSVAKCCQQEKVKNLLHSPMRNLKSEASPSPRSRRQKMYTEKKEARKWADAAQFARRDFISPNFKNTPRHSITRESQQLSQEELHSNPRDCSHYLDLARLKMSEAKPHQNDPRWLNPAYCSPRHIEKGHKNCHFQRCNNSDFVSPSTPKKHGSEIRHKHRDTELHSEVLKHKLLQKAKSNLLDLSFDLCDLEDKQSVEQIAQHRRSRSYDTNEYSFVNSPQLATRTCRCPKCIVSTNFDETVQLSPGRRHRHCHRKREKEKLRAMEQVARWLEREDSSTKQQLQNGSQNSDSCTRDNVVERHEYHHIHEHHHYYHYVES